MYTSTSSSVSAILASYDFSPINQIVDNGQNLFVGEIFKVNSAIESILRNCAFAPRTAARPLIQGKNIADRYKCESEALAESIPDDGDVYIMKNFIYNWNSDRTLNILKNCHQIMADRGRLLLLETAIPSFNKDNRRTTSREWLDLTLFLMTGATSDRREAKYRQLLAKAGFKLAKVIYTQSPIAAIEAVKVGDK